MGVVVVEVFGAFTRAFREADLRRADSFLGTRARDKHGIVPDLQLGVPFYDVKGIRSGQLAKFSIAKLNRCEVYKAPLITLLGPSA